MAAAWWATSAIGSGTSCKPSLAARPRRRNEAYPWCRRRERPPSPGTRRFRTCRHRGKGFCLFGIISRGREFWARTARARVAWRSSFPDAWNPRSLAPQRAAPQRRACSRSSGKSYHRRSMNSRHLVFRLRNLVPIAVPYRPGFGAVRNARNHRLLAQLMHATLGSRASCMRVPNARSAARANER